jgi:hypothetical protein
MTSGGLDWILVISGPLTLVGVGFLVSWWAQRGFRQPV